MKCFKISTKKKVFLNLINFLIFGSLIFLIMFSTSITETSMGHIEDRNLILENVWREQARISLLDIKEQFLLDLANGMVDSADDDSLYQWAETRLSGRRVSGPGGDAFIISFPNEKIIWDNSLDTVQEQNRYLGSSLHLHEDPNLAKSVYSEMRKLYITTPSSKQSWNFDGNPEFLEWTVVPTERSGFNNEPKFVNGQINPDYKVLLIGYGLQKDEITDDFKLIDKDIEMQIKKLTLLNYFLTFGGIIFVFWFFYLELTKKDETQ